MSRILPESIQDQIRSFPEWSMGANRVTVTLNDGRQVHGVFVAWGNVFRSQPEQPVVGPDGRRFVVMLKQRFHCQPPVFVVEVREPELGALVCQEVHSGRHADRVASRRARQLHLDIRMGNVRVG